MSAPTSEPGDSSGNAGARLEATASGKGRVYQAGRDQHFLNFVIPRGIRNALLTLMALVLIAGGGWMVMKWVVPLSAPTYKTQFLIDTTASGALDTSEAIADSLKTVVGNSGTHDALALRSFGGECGADDNTRQLVGFGTDNRQKIAQAAEGTSVSGKATLLRGIVQAVEDFSTTFALGADQRAKQVNRIIVVTRHGRDACDEDTAFVHREIQDRIRAAGLEIQFRLIGYQIPDDQRNELEQIATTGSQATDPMFANTPSDLNAALEWSTNTEPVLRNATKIVGTLNPAVEQINTAVQAINDGRLNVAERNLDRARSTSTGTEFEDLQGRTKSPEGSDIHDRAAKLRDQQKRVLTTADHLYDAARSNRPLGPEHTAFEKAAEAYNTQVKAMNNALATLRAKAPAAR